MKDYKTFFEAFDKHNCAFYQITFVKVSARITAYLKNEYAYLYYLPLIDAYVCCICAF